MAAGRLIVLGLASAALTGAGLEAQAGRGVFEHAWILAPASLSATSGLGPHYDARSCAACHPGAGAGRAGEGAIGAGMVVRLGDGEGRTDPVYGRQLQSKATPGVHSEAQARLDWTEDNGRRRPRLAVADFGYGPAGESTRAEVRRAPGLDGLAELDSIPDATIFAAARRPRPDGVRGRVNLVADASGQLRPGRWGWKATAPGLDEQAATSLARDLGVATSLRPAPGGDETPAEARVDHFESGRPGAADPALHAIVAYLKSLPTPPAPPVSAEVARAGRAAFNRAGCGACHADLAGADGRPVAARTDLLLHDMGPGLDSGVADGGARSFEWRTAPLWNLAAELKQGGLLHDGRARSLSEAVAWHDGEARRSRLRFQAMNDRDRRAVAAWLGIW